MKVIEELCDKARQTRDNAIEAARAEYVKTMEDIAALEQRLFPPPTVERPQNTRSKPLIDLIVDCLPRNRKFDVNTIRGRLREADPQRTPSADVVRSNFHRLLRQGVLKQTQRAVGKAHALFAIASLHVEHNPQRANGSSGHWPDARS